MGAAQLSPSLSELAFDFFGHSHDWEHFSVTQRHLQIFQGRIALRAIKRDAAQRGAHFQARETRFAGGVLASFQEQRANAAPRPSRMHEERANLRGITRGIEQGVLAAGILIAEIQKAVNSDW